MELKVIPVIQVLIAVLLMVMFSQLWPGLILDWPAHKQVALLLFILAIFVGISALISFKMHKTTVNPIKPETTTTIVSSGIYSFSRNPMYLAMLISLISVAYYLQHVTSLPVLLIFIAYMTRFQIIPEEKILTKTFGQQYVDYQNKVRRWS
jgi:protein-S-isoprenylcysteine O-methyltransferase Ste14